MTHAAIVPGRPFHGIRSAITAGAVATLLAAPVRGAEAQGGSTGAVGARVDALQTGTIRMVYAPRAGVCGDGMSWYRLRAGNTSSITGTFYNSSGGRDVEVTCDPGPVRVVVVREHGETRQIRTYVGGRWRVDTGATDIGTVSAPDAARWLLNVAEHGSERIASSALQAATLADSVDAGGALLRIATDARRPNGIRSSAMHWLGEVAGEKVAARLDSIAYEPGDRELRKQAIMALSRRPVEESVPNLLKMVESLPDRELRKAAVQALANTKDPRAIAWITRTVGER